MCLATFLIVDDNDAVRRSLRDWLSLTFEHSQFHEASTGEQAIKVAHKHSLDIVLMDFALPGLNGIEAIKAIQSISPGASFVMISIHESAQHKVDAVRAGALALIPKRKLHSDLVPLLKPLVERLNHTSEAVS
jgi:DNA-binding NarL/FixJ family response regulator